MATHQEPRYQQYIYHKQSSPDVTIIHALFYLLPILPATRLRNFFYCTIKDWNDLPLNFYSIPTLSSFIKSTISAHINGCNNTYNI